MPISATVLLARDPCLKSLPIDVLHEILGSSLRGDPNQIKLALSTFSANTHAKNMMPPKSNKVHILFFVGFLV